MILKLILGRGFRGALSYVAAATKSATTDHTGAVAPLFTNMAGRSPRELAAEFGTLRKLRPNLTKAVGHLILSHDPRQRPLTESEWKEAIQIALQTHGADQAAFAAWQHHDTGTAHCHVIFSRVLTTNEVVSDSNSYRTNERAARLIERTLMLDVPISSPAADKSGDRKAVYNAKKRAERTSTSDPTLISPQTVREALAAAKNLEEYQRQLEERDIEIEFDRRGAEQEIYGFRLRRKGAQEWLKASSVHKDLSWPKVAHRFAESNSTKQTPTEQPVIPAITFPAAPVQQLRQLDRPPQQLQPVPQAVYAANQTHAPGMMVRRLGQLSETADNMAPAMNTIFLQSAWALAKVAVFCATAAARLAAAVWAFVQKLLALFGLKTNEPLQYQEQTITPQLSYEPVHHGRVLDTDELGELDNNAASAIDHVLVCVKSGMPDALPEDVEGRAELVATLTSQAKTVTPAAAEADSLNAMFDDHQTAPAPKIQPIEAKPDTLVLLSTSMAEFLDASIQRTDAREKETPQVTAARKNHALAVHRLKQAKLNYEMEKARKGRLSFLLQSESVVVEDEKIEFDRAEKSLANAVQQHPTVVPPALLERHANALAKVKAAAAQHHAKMMREVDQHDNGKVKKIALYQAQSFKAQLDIFERAPIAGHLYNAVQLAEAAPKVIALEVALAEKQIKIEALDKMEVPNYEKEEERQGQVQK